MGEADTTLAAAVTDGRIAAELVAQGIRDAEQRGRAQAEVQARLTAHDLHFAGINGHIADLAGSVKVIETQMVTSATAQAVRDEDAKKASDNQLSARTFLLGCAGLFVAAVTTVIGLLAVLGSI